MNNGKFLKFSSMDDAQYQSLSQLISQKYPDAKIDQIGESFGKSLQSQAALALLFSFIGMASGYLPHVSGHSFLLLPLSSRLWRIW